MPLVAAKIQKDLQAAIYSAMQKEFAGESGADTTAHKRIAAAVAKGVAEVLIQALKTEAEVLAGIPTAGSPAAQVTTSVGKIS